MRKVVSYKTYGTTPYVNKYVDLGDSQGRGGSCWIVLRYADVILMLAEVNEALNLESEAITYIDMIRTRAKLKPYDQASETYKTAIQLSKRSFCTNGVSNWLLKIIVGLIFSGFIRAPTW